MFLKALLLKGMVGAAVAVAATGAAVHHAPKVKLALVPLPKSALGPAAASLKQTQNALTFGGAGTGEYSLDYGFSFSGKSGVAAIDTSAARYSSPAAARHALTRARKNESFGTGGLEGITITAKALKLPAVGDKHFAELLTISTNGAATVYEVDEEFADHTEILSATVAASSVKAAKRLAPKLAQKLAARLALARAGKLHGKVPKPPREPAPGPPAGGPDLSTLTLTSADFGTATAQQQGYQPPDFGGASAYTIEWQPAGTYDAADQIVSWCGNANEATWNTALYVAIFSVLTGAAPDQITPVDVTAVGDGATGEIVQVTQSGSTAWYAIIGLSSGDASDVVIAVSQTQIQPTDVQSLAQSAANRLNAGLGG